MGLKAVVPNLSHDLRQASVGHSRDTSVASAFAILRNLKNDESQPDAYKVTPKLGSQCLRIVTLETTEVVEIHLDYVAFRVHVFDVSLNQCVFGVCVVIKYRFCGFCHLY